MRRGRRRWRRRGRRRGSRRRGRGKRRRRRKRRGRKRRRGDLQHLRRNSVQVIGHGKEVTMKYCCSKSILHFLISTEQQIYDPTLHITIHYLEKAVSHYLLRKS